MANVMEILSRIKTAIYGRDVRQSIYDAILQCYNDATGNPESIAAHTGDTDNPHNVTADQVGLGTAAEDISGLKNPEFEDFAADGSTPPDAKTAIAAITSKMSLFTYLSKVKAALMGLVTLGEMRSLLINNGLTTEAGKYFLDAAYGKTLADLVASNASAITQLNSERQLDNVTKTIFGVSTENNPYIALQPSKGERRQITIVNDGMYYGYNASDGTWHDLWNVVPGVSVPKTKYITANTISEMFANFSEPGNIPVIGVINYTSPIAPDSNTCFVFLLSYLALAFSSTGKFFVVRSNENSWTQTN